MEAIPADTAPRQVGGPALVAATAGLALLPENASRHVRLHRLAALGMALGGENTAPVSPSAVKALLKSAPIGGPGIIVQEDPYSEVLVQSISFFGGPYLVSPGSGEHTVADVENLVDAAFREPWTSAELRDELGQLVQGMLIVSDTVLRRGGLTRGTFPSGSPGSPMLVPGATRLNELAQATFLSNEDLLAHGQWLCSVIDALALDPGELNNPCKDDIDDDRLYRSPFLRLTHGYQVALPLDLLITTRFHLLRMAQEAGVLEELGSRVREAAFRRLMRQMPSGASPELLEHDDLMSRYLVRIDSKSDLHIVVATDPLKNWQPEVWGQYDTRATLDRIRDLMSPGARTTYSSARTLLHLVLTDSPGRGAFWGIPNVEDADPVLMVRSDDLEVMIHHESDGPLGLLLFAEAVENRPGESMSTSILDEFSSYLDHERSFYFSDDAAPGFVLFQNGDGLFPRQTYITETDLHGVFPPVGHPSLIQIRRRYRRDAPEIYLSEPGSSYVGYVIELGDHSVFLTIASGDRLDMVRLNLLECVAYWVRESARLGGQWPLWARSEIVISLSSPEAWESGGNSSSLEPPIVITVGDNWFALEFTESFAALLQDRENNSAERELVSTLLRLLFGVADTELDRQLEAIAPLSSKRMLSAFDQNSSPDMLATQLPRPLHGHDQVMAQLLDELGEWLRSSSGADRPVGPVTGEDRVKALNSVVGHLFSLLEGEVAKYDGRSLLEYLITQNEALVHDVKFNSVMLRSRLACFGEQSEAVAELVAHRKDSASTQRTNRFLIEYVAARPPVGTEALEVRDYYRLLSIGKEIIDRATASDFLHYGLADFQVTILDSGRLGLNRDAPITAAFDTYLQSSGQRTIREAQKVDDGDGDIAFDYAKFVDESESAALAEFGFSFNELREVCGGLLDLAAADRVTRVKRSEAVVQIAADRGLTENKIEAVLDRITLTERKSFLEIKEDSWPWRFNRDMTYLRRPLVVQGDELVFGFRSIYGLGPFWLNQLLSGRLQGRASTIQMQRCISEARRAINSSFALAVAEKFRELGMTTRTSVKKIGKRRIVDSSGQDLGDIDVLAIDSRSRSIFAVEAKDFEVARTPAELSNEIEKLFAGKNSKKSAVELHARRVDWLKANLREVVADFDGEPGDAPWQLVGMVVTSDPLITPLVTSSALPVVPFDQLGTELLGSFLTNRRRSSSRGKRHR